MGRTTVGSGRGMLGAISSEEGHRVTTLELFFDLAFVFAFTQLSRLMAQEHDALGVVQALVILALLWWSWTAYGWLANLAHADAGIVRIAMIVAMTAMLVVGLVVLEAYVDLPGGLSGPLVFVGAYLVARVTHAIVFVAVEEDGAVRRRALLTVCLSIIPSGALLITGALLGSPWQLWLAIAAVAIEPLVSYRMSLHIEWRVHSTAHFTERHGLIVILALGESIIAIGVGVAHEPVSIPILAGVVLAMLISVALWWAYFSRLAHRAEAALGRLRGSERARTASGGYTYLHLAIVAGIVLAALGLEDATAHVAEAVPFGLFGAAALGGGVSLYLAGTGFFARRVIGEWRLVRFGGALVLLAAIPVLAVVPPLAALALVAGLLVVLLVVEHVSAERATASTGYESTAGSKTTTGVSVERSVA
jgi:low temperature requirement protein LtrA